MKKALDISLLSNQNTQNMNNSYPLQVYSHLENPKHPSQKTPLLNLPYGLQPCQDQMN